MHSKSAKDAGGAADEKKKANTRVSSDGQIEMTIAESPLYESSEELVKAKARVGAAQDNLIKAEKAWIDEMKKIKKQQINHKGDIIEFVRGRTTEDHARFKKS